MTVHSDNNFMVSFVNHDSVLAHIRATKPPKNKEIRLFTDTEPVESHCPVCLVCIGEFFYFYQPLYHRRYCFICVCVCVSSRLNDVLEKLTAARTTAKVDSSTFAFCLRTDLVKHQSAAVITFNRCLGEYKIESEDLVGLCHDY